MNVDTAAGKVSTTIEYYDFGAAVDVSAPPADDVFDFSELFGGLRRLRARRDRDRWSIVAAKPDGR